MVVVQASATPDSIMVYSKEMVCWLSRRVR